MPMFAASDNVVIARQLTTQHRAPVPGKCRTNALQRPPMGNGVARPRAGRQRTPSQPLSWTDIRDGRLPLHRLPNHPAKARG